MHPDMRADDLEAVLADERTPQGLTWLDVLDAACAVCNVRRAAALEIVVHPVAGVGFQRFPDLCLARKLAWATVRELGGWVEARTGRRRRYSFPYIGHVWARLDHTTVMSGIRSVSAAQVGAVVARLPRVAGPGLASTMPPGVPEQLVLRGVG